MIRFDNLYIYKKLILRKLYFLVLLSCSVGVNAQFIQGFEGSQTIGDGFTVINQGASATWNVLSDASTSHSGINRVHLSYSSADPATNDILITPAITVTEGVSDRLSFWYRTYSSTATKVKLGYGNSSISEFNTLLSVLPGTNMQWQHATVILNDYIGQTVYVGFHTQTNVGTNISFDDIISTGSSSFCALTAPTITGSSLTACDPSPAKTVHFTGLPEGNWILHKIGTFTGIYSGSGTTFDAPVSAYDNAGQHLRFFVETLDGCISPETPEIYLGPAYDVAPGYMPTTTIPVDIDSNGMLNAGDKIKYLIHVQNTGQCPLEINHINGYEPEPSNPNLYFADGITRCADLPAIPGMETLIVEMFYTLTEADIAAGYVFNHTYVTVNWVSHANILTMDNTAVLATLGLQENFGQPINYYPNPVVGKLFFNAPDAVESIAVYSLSGQLLKTEKVNGNEVDFSQLSAGIYIAKISTGGNTKTIRVVKN